MLKESGRVEGSWLGATSCARLECASIGIRTMLHKSTEKSRGCELNTAPAKCDLDEERAPAQNGRDMTASRGRNSTTRKNRQQWDRSAQKATLQRLISARRRTRVDVQNFLTTVSAKAVPKSGVKVQRRFSLYVKCGRLSLSSRSFS